MPKQQNTHSRWTPRVLLGVALVLVGFSISFFTVEYHYLGVGIAVAGLASLAFIRRG